MMKWGFALNAAVGAVIVASAIGVQSSGNLDLDLSLDRVARGLEELGGLRARIDRGDRTAVAALIERTEAPAGDTRAEEERLAQLRFDVSRLQMEWDALAATLPVEASPAWKPGAEPSSTASTKPSGPANGPVAFEAPGFSADPLKQGEAYYRAGKYAAALAILRTAPDDARCQYWSARALEQLGKIEEALALYAKVAARKDAGWASARARTDLEFLEWKRDNAARPGDADAKGAGSP